MTTAAFTLFLRPQPEQGDDLGVAAKITRGQVASVDLGKLVRVRGKILTIRLPHLFILYAFRQVLDINVTLNMFQCIIHFIKPVHGTVHMSFKHLITEWLASLEWSLIYTMRWIDAIIARDEGPVPDAIIARDPTADPEDEAEPDSSNRFVAPGS
ncbi:hypothetical protein ZIOFF_070838 [Zingiber officinale]|uniref:Uncharacterized protein n=1 Tax=Zingiber officinale TaxID=94328 RepID=A0A8J5ENB1_ZINOF|nr:hypothetical protein ZIOFF_070838 [Zingiber officinale]